MKYRKLNIEELKELEKEFVNFLSSQTITADEWVKIKEEQPDKADGLIDIFSDVVFDKILSKVEYLEHKREKDLRVYRFFDDHIKMYGIMVKGKNIVDFTRNESPEEMITQLQISGGQVQFFTGEKKYKFSKEKEIFLIMEEGALISKDSTLYDSLKQLKQ